MNETLRRIVKLLDEQGTPVKQRRRELEAITGASYSAVSQWFNGHTKEITYGNLKKIADHFGVKVEYLMCTEDENIPNQLDKRLTLLWDSLDKTQKEITLATMEGIKKASQAQK